MSSNVPVWAVIPAAGTGRRMQSDTAKQYLSFQGKTIIGHCLDRLLSLPAIAGAVVVLAKDDETWDRLEYNAAKPVITVTGGNERQDSVYHGLIGLQQQVGDNVMALVHDAVRPLVSHEDLARVIDAARQNSDGAILAAPVADTLKQQNENQQIAATVPRDRLWRALTPQVFHLLPLLQALKRVIDDQLAITDDAQAMEMMGYAPTLVAGSSENLKITTREDLSLAERIWLNQRDQQDDE